VTNHEPPKHLADKYRCYAIWIEDDGSGQQALKMILVHVGRPISFKTLLETYIFQHLELTTERDGRKIPTRLISGVQKVPNQNTPDYELRQDGTLGAIG
jgi:hypothetical protein